VSIKSRLDWLGDKRHTIPFGRNRNDGPPTFHPSFRDSVLPRRLKLGSPSLRAMGQASPLPLRMSL
jgi:hypothetical protein